MQTLSSELRGVSYSSQLYEYYKYEKVHPFKKDGPSTVDRFVVFVCGMKSSEIESRSDDLSQMLEAANCPEETPITLVVCNAECPRDSLVKMTTSRSNRLGQAPLYVAELRGKSEKPNLFVALERARKLESNGLRGDDVVGNYVDLAVSDWSSPSWSAGKPVCIAQFAKILRPPGILRAKGGQVYVQNPKRVFFEAGFSQTGGAFDDVPASASERLTCIEFRKLGHDDPMILPHPQRKREAQKLIDPETLLGLKTLAAAKDEENKKWFHKFKVGTAPHDHTLVQMTG